MIEINDLLKIEKDEKAEVLAVKNMTEGVPENNLGKPFNEEDLCFLCQRLGINITRVLWKAWRMLRGEDEDGMIYVNLRKAALGKMRPRVLTEKFLRMKNWFGCSVLFCKLRHELNFFVFLIIRDPL